MPSPFQTEAWTEYGIGMAILLTRLSARTWQLGSKWQGDDYFSMLAVLFFTAELVMLELIGQNGAITGLTEEAALSLTPEQAKRVVVGSKCLLAGWILYTTLIWCLKACMLFFYSRLTMKLQQHRLVKITAVICIMAYIATITVYLTRCYPLHNLWQIYPYPGDECALNLSNYLALVVTNVTTDLLIFYIPLPILWTVQMPLRRKILFGLWLCTGVFIMVATLLRCILALQDVSQINVSTIWSIRETFVGIIAVNLPVLKPFISQVTHAVSSTASKKQSRASSHTLSNSFQLSQVDRLAKKKKNMNQIITMDDSSEEHMVKQHKDGTESQLDLTRFGQAPSSMSRSTQGEDGIHITQHYEVSYSPKNSVV